MRVLVLDFSVYKEFGRLGFDRTELERPTNRRLYFNNRTNQIYKYHRSESINLVL